MLNIKEYPETSSEDNSLYNIYTLSFNNIKVPNKSYELARHFNRILLLEERLLELINQFQNFVKLPEQNLVLARRPLSSHSELKWKIKYKEKGV